MNNTYQPQNLDKVSFGVSNNNEETQTRQLRLNKQIIGGLQNGGGDINALAFSGSNASFCCPTIPNPQTDIKTLNSIGGFKCAVVRNDINNYIRLNQ